MMQGKTAENHTSGFNLWSNSIVRQDGTAHHATLPSQFETRYHAQHAACLLGMAYIGGPMNG